MIHTNIACIFTSFPDFLGVSYQKLRPKNEASYICLVRLLDEVVVINKSLYLYKLSLVWQPYFSLFTVGGVRGREKYVWSFPGTSTLMYEVQI